MPNLKAPLLSLGASGTLGNSLTFTERPSGSRVQTVPSHPDPQSLPQLYQRWRFRDANFYWLSLSPAEKQAYRSQRYPPHMTGQQRCIRYYLRHLPDLALHLHLDSRTGFTATDYSLHGNHGIITGASPTPAVIDYGRLFDGIDDQIDVPHHASLNMGVSDFTLLCWFADTAQTSLWTKYQVLPRLAYFAYVRPGPPPDAYFELSDGVWRPYFINFLTDPLDNQLHHIALAVHRTHLLYLYLDGILQGTADISASTGSIDNTNPFVFSRPGPRLHGPADDIRIYSRLLSADHIAYIATQERYPIAA